MIAVLGNVLSEAEVTALREAAAAVDFKDGRATAGRYARDVKRNEQAAKSDILDGILEKARAALNANEAFRSIARPRKFVRLLLSRYQPGMEYGTHVDDAIMAGARTDLSFTLFLSDPGDYEGGELEIDLAGMTQSIKLDAGDMVLYPSTSLHRVAPVTSGKRLVCVGWIESSVPDAAVREIIFDLENLRSSLSGRLDLQSPEMLVLSKSISNLVRRFGQS